MRIFGTILPFIGFRDEEVTADMREVLEIPPHVKTLETFQIEWLGTAIVVACEKKTKEKP